MLEPGRILGDRYEILKKIGAGGMSIVYLAKCNKLQRNVAIKVLREEFATDEAFVKKFRAEALSAASLSHPNVVGIYDVAIDDELKYIVMEYIEGETLKEYLQKYGPFTSEQTLEFGMQMVSAVKHAHKKQIIHRDIKPQNILITHEDVLKVADFGIARAVDSSTIVATGNAIGSVHYFSPEQAKGKYVNETSDLYSCGIVLFELATNQLPFQADSHVSIALKHINEPLPAPSSINPNIVKGLEQIILKATQKDQKDRYQTADEMLEDMKRVLIDPNAYIEVPEEKDDYTILLSRDETAYLRNNEKAQLQVEQYFDEDDEEQEDDDDISPLYKFLVGLGAICATLVVLGIGIFAWLFWKPIDKGPKDVAVPPIVGMSIEEATDRLKQDGLLVKVMGHEESTKLETGDISKQSPKAQDIVKEGTEVQVIVVENPEIVQVDVIDVIGQSGADAQAALKKLNLNVKTERAYHETLEMGKVIDQLPLPNTTVEAGTTVVLTISNGPQVIKVNVPNLYDLTEDAAKLSLNNAGLLLGQVTKGSHPTIEAGKIFEQGISAETPIEKGTAIDIKVSTGPEVPVDPETTPEGEETNPENPNEGDFETGDATTGQEQVTKTHIIRPLNHTNKTEHHILVMLENDEGSRLIFDQMVGVDQLPLSIPVSGTGRGTLVTFFDSQEEYRDEINFDEVTQ